MLYLDATLVGAAYARLRTQHRDGAVVIAGLGNIRQGDEGAGVHVVHRLAMEPTVPGVRLVLAGTRAMRVLPELADARALILVAAARDGNPAGSVQYSCPANVNHLPPSLACERWGLHALLSTAALCGRLPPLHIYTLSVCDCAIVPTGLSAALEAAVAVATCMIHGHARRLAAAMRAA